ncbi:MAG: NAD(P)/FAD-dependent oxidoreductase [Bacilli bacterium]
MFDVLIIGAGITGTLIARELSRYQIDVAVLEKCNDVGNKTTNANSAIVHSGYDPEPGSNKAKFNVLGNHMFDQLTEELDVPFERLGSLTVALEDEQIPLLEDLIQRSQENHVPVQLLTGVEAQKIEPHLSKEVKAALLAPTAGIVDPFELCVHAMENAIDNGVHLLLNEEVVAIKKVADYFLVKTKTHEYQSRIIINAAGNFADCIAGMIETIDWKITSRKGEYFVLDHFQDDYVKHTIFPLPTSKGKGVLVSPTTSGNYIVGPSSEEILRKDDYATDSLTLKQVKEHAVAMFPDLPFNQVIRVFSGLRPSCSRHDFIIEYAKTDSHFINVAGIESPGLVSSPAIAKFVVDDLVKPIISLEDKPSFNPRVRPYYRLSQMLKKHQEAFVKEHPTYGEIVCNCEKVSLGEIEDALSRSCPPRSVKGLKRRTRAGFGKCQGSFCQPRVVLILAKHYGVSPLDIPLDDVGSNILLEKIKEVK